MAVQRELAVQLRLLETHARRHALGLSLHRVPAREDKGGARGRPQHEAAEQLRPLRPHLGRRRLQQRAHEAQQICTEAGVRHRLLGARGAERGAAVVLFRQAGGRDAALPQLPLELPGGGAVQGCGLLGGGEG